MIVESDVVAAVAALSPTALLPARLTTEGVSLPATLDVVAVESFAPNQWLTLLSSGDNTYVCPLVVDGTALRRAVPGDGASSALVARLMSGSASGGPFDWRRLGRGRVEGDERAMDVDQTHQSVVVAESAVVKWMVHAEPSPAPDLIAHLVANGFTQLPRPWGFVTVGRAADQSVVASVSDFLPGASDGWSWMVDDVASHGLGLTTPEEALVPPASLGAVVGDMHVALSMASGIIADPAAVATSSDIAAWHSLAKDLLDEATRVVSGAEGARLRASADRIAGALGTMTAVDRTTTMPIHGDLHVGQVLRWDQGYAVNDFDGNPVLTVAERLRPQPAARDVAGMLQSIDHVARVVVKRREGVDHDVVRGWIPKAQRAFLASYRSVLRNCGREHLLDSRLLTPFRVEQELREFLYAERHLPRWRYVPDAALADMFP